MFNDENGPRRWWAFTGMACKEDTVKPAAHIPTILSIDIGDARESVPRSPPERLTKIVEEKNEETMLNKIPADKIAFSKELHDHDDGSCERAEWSLLALNTVPLGLIEHSILTMEQASSYRASDTGDHSLTVSVPWTPVTSLTNRITALKISPRSGAKSDVKRTRKDTGEPLYAFKWS